MKKSRVAAFVGTPIVAVLIGLTLMQMTASADKAKKPNKRAVARTRKTVKMLDDVYKTAVVLITTH
ncbi:MAG: hypothetical protein HON53_05015, partial [Planctomycetaceae bacterium]|nr:hypothetical protein [Planctomycetaceae bacterium]